MTVCLVDDAFVRDNVRWVVLLDDGHHVYQDDDRPGMIPKSAWIRLGQHCREQGARIVRMWFQFRSHRVEVGPPNAPAYFFARSAMAVCGDITYHGYVGGHLLDDGRLAYTRWLTPALVPLESGVRDLRPEQSECLIDFRDRMPYNGDGTRFTQSEDRFYGHEKQEGCFQG